ncbi:hypothetical protein AGMMS50225_28600 [Betaproteobacteria bacterium]|nr:hypothetical protein AGMMS50225_28600 [Betaproteobacteria bacterium]
MQNRNATDFYLKHRFLVGGIITGLERTAPGNDDFDEEFYGLIITPPDSGKRTLILLSDDEGNASGSFEIGE